MVRWNEVPFEKPRYWSTLPAPGKGPRPLHASARASFSHESDTLHTLDDTFQNGDSYVVGHVLPAVGEGEQRVPRDPTDNVVCRMAAP